MITAPIIAFGFRESYLRSCVLLTSSSTDAEQFFLLILPGKCSEDGWKNNKYQFYCKEENKCLSEDLKCDAYGADNCGDGTDNLAGRPSFCGPKERKLSSLLSDYDRLKFISVISCFFYCSCSAAMVMDFTRSSPPVVAHFLVLLETWLVGMADHILVSTMLSKMLPSQCMLS